MQYLRQLTNRYFKWAIWGLLLNASAVFSSAATPVQWDEKLTVKTLDNGFRYIVYDSNKREEPFNLRLIVDVGSVDDDLKGMAHIIEHMVFRTNKGYSKSIHHFMDDIGWKSGLQMNALTRQANTQFMVRTRPNDSLNLEQSIELLANLAFQASLLDSDWQVERKVILEEMRLGSGLAERVNRLKKAVVRNGSRYVGRPPIGTKNDIGRTTIEDILSFYKKYYVPANMTLVVSGEIDPALLDRAIQNTFGQQPVSTPDPRDYLELPLKKQLHIARVQDEDGISSIVAMGFRSRLKPYTNVDGLYERLQNYFLRKLVGQQVRDQRSIYADSDIESVSITFNEPTNERQVVAMAARTDNHDHGLKAVITEIERLRQNGLDAAAFAALKAQARASIENNRRLVGQRDFQQWEDKITTAVMQGGVLENYEVRAKRNLVWIDQMTLAELNERLNQLLSAEDQFIYYQLPGGVQRDLPTAEQVSRIQRSAAEQKLAAGKPFEPQKAALATDARDNSHKTLTVHWPEFAKATPDIIGERQWDELNVKRWQLKNGDSVVCLNRPTPHGQLYIKALSNGGYRNKQIPLWLSQAAVQVWEQADLSFASAEAIGQWQKDSKIDWQWAQKEHELDLGTVIQPDQLDDAMKLYRARVQNWQLDDAGFTEVLEALKVQTDKAARTAEASVRKQLFEDSQSELVPTRQRLDDLSRTEFEVAIRDFSQQPATFFMVGEVAEGQIVDSVLGHLDGLSRTTPLDLKDNRLPSGRHREDIAVFKDDKATVKIKSSTDMPWTPETSFLVSTLNPIIQKALKNELRHALGGIYLIKFEMQLRQNGQVVTEVDFTCDPTRVDELISATERVYQNLSEAIARENLERVRQAVAFAESLRLKDSNTWLRRLVLSFERYQSPEYLKNMDTLTQQINQDSLVLLAEQIFPQKNQAILVSLPVSK